MVLVVKFILFLIALVLISAPFVFIHIRKIFRDQKNYERGLKMIPLLIHLPPQSDDVENRGGRDVRDVNEESISKAQIIYNILSSTWEKGLNKQFYGQKHISFEIVALNGFIYYYAVAPISIVDVVKQAIISAYPTARIEETSEHNIFNSAGKITSTLGGEFLFKESFVYPIATYQQLKRDAMQAILGSFSNLSKEDGAAIQILLRPANPSWRKTAANYSSKKRKGEKSRHGFEAIFYHIKTLISAISNPLEDSKNNNSSQNDGVSSLESSELDAIDEKTKHPGFEVIIRVIVSSNTIQRSQSVLTTIISSFALFDAPGKNGFKFVSAKDVEKFTTGYILRFFPQQNKKTILNAVELSSIFHFPDQSNIPTSQLVKQASKQVDGPRNIPEDGLLLGYNVFRGIKKPIRLALNDRRRHIYAVGQTGTGKSIFLENLALQDMINGNGFAFVDPHGDTVEDLLAMVPKERVEDVIYFSPSDMDYPIGLNFFEFDHPDQKDFIIQESLNMLYKLYDPEHTGIIGPRYEHIFRMAAMTIMSGPDGGTFIDIPKLFRDNQYVEKKLKYIDDQIILDFWRKEMPQSQRSNEFGELISWFVSKFGAFQSNAMMRNIIGQSKGAFNLREIMDKKKILLVNLSKGGVGELNSKLLGMIFVIKFQAAAMSRVNVPESERVDFALYVDEFQNFSTDSLATIMSEARKFRLNLIVANQFTTQLSNEIRDSVFGNIGTIISFRIGQNDVETVGKYFSPIFEAEDLLRVPNYNTIVRTLIGGVPTQPFSMATLPQLGKPNKKLSDALKQLSYAKYGRPRAVVEKEIFDRLSVGSQDIAPSKSKIDELFSKTYQNKSDPGNGINLQQDQNKVDETKLNKQTLGSNGSASLDNNKVFSAEPKKSFVDDWLKSRKELNRNNPIIENGNVSSRGNFANNNLSNKNVDDFINSQVKINNSGNNIKNDENVNNSSTASTTNLNEGNIDKTQTLDKNNPLEVQDGHIINISRE